MKNEFLTAGLYWAGFNPLNYSVLLHESNPHIISSTYINAAFAIIIILCIAIILYQYIQIQKKNHRLAKFIMQIYDKAYEITPKKKNMSSSHAEGDNDITLEKTDSTNKTDVNDKELFVRFNKIVQSDKLYLNYNLGRDDYSRIMGVDKNRFASIMKRYGGGNISTYLNELRLKYSVRLMLSEEKISINDIAVRSAFPNVSTFYRLFKEKYGESPKTFREKNGKSITELSEDDVVSV